MKKQPISLTLLESINIQQSEIGLWSTLIHLDVDAWKQFQKLTEVSRILSGVSTMEITFDEPSLVQILPSPN